MARRRRRGPRITGIRKTIKKGAGAIVGITGLAIAMSPLLNAVAANAQPGQTINPQALLGQVSNIYGINPANPGATDIGKLITTIVFPLVGGLVFIKGMRMIVRSV